MTPAFGFSVGDFISAIELCGKVSKALKDTAVGASADYQHVVLELHSLQTALSRLASLEPSESNINHVNAIRGMALTCQLPLQEFLSNIEKYEKTMGPFARSSLRGAGHKARWAVFVTQEVKKIRALISAKALSINLLLAMHTSETVSTLESRGRSQHNELLRNIEEHRSKIEGVSRRVEEVKDEVAQSSQAAATRIQNLDTDLKSRIDGVSENTAELAQNMSTLSVQMESTQNSLLSLRNTGSHILAFLRKFPADIRALMQSIVRSNLQMYYILLKIDGKVSASPSLLNQSNIRFEDALGVVRELPHEWFKHWEPFDGLLRAQFKGAPGEQKVLQGLYNISYAKRPGVLIGKEDWTRSIQPGSEIVMSVLLTELLWQKTSCPRPSCSGKPYFDSDKPSIVVCPLCGLRYFPLPSTFHHTPKHLPASEEDLISQNQAEEDLELFGNRNLPLDISSDNTDVLAQDASEAIPSYEISEVHMLDREGNEFEDAGEASSVKDIDIDNEMAKETPPAHILQESLPRPPLLSWLDQTESPNNSTKIQDALQEKQARQYKAKAQETEDLELLRNVHVISSERVPAEAALHDPFLDSGEDELELAARIYYRNIVDRYPAVPRYLARRLAVANLSRSKRLSPTGNFNSAMEKTKRLRSPSLVTAACGNCQTWKLCCSFGPVSDRSKCLNCERLKLKCDFSLTIVQTPPPKRGRKNSNPSNYWTMAPEPSRPASHSSSMNSSLHGYEVFDPQEQNMNVPVSRPGSASSLGSGAGLPSLALPPPPVQLPSKYPFDCDICGITIRVERKRDWKKHVLYDLQPYICLLENCNSPERTFSKRRDLIDHESFDHERTETFYQCVIPGCEAKLKDPLCVNLHQSTTHTILMPEEHCRIDPGGIVSTKYSNFTFFKPLFAEVCDTCEGSRTCNSFVRPCRQCQLIGIPCGNTKQQLDTIHSFDLSKIEFPDFRCPFCEELIAPGNLPRSHHLGRHMEEISFAVVTKPYEDWQFYDDSSSGDS